MSQAVYREVHPPTAVTHCAEAYFTHAGGSKGSGAAGATPSSAGAPPPPNLVLARGTRLEVYGLNFGPGVAFSSASAAPLHPLAAAALQASGGNCRLELLGAFQCWGVIEDLAVLRGRASSGQRDSLVLAFRDAKLSVVEWDDQQHGLRNGSLHCFEGDPALREGEPWNSLGPGSSLVGVPPRVAADPAGRCATALLYGRQLAVLPAIQADVMEMLLQQEGGAAKGSSTGSASVGNSYCVNLGRVTNLKLTSGTAVRAMVFLHGFTEPLLCLLHETAPTWGGRLKETKDSCCLSALSINTRRKKQPVIWSVPSLPSDCCSLLAVPRGGVLLLSTNLVMYFAQGGQCVMAINSNAFAGEVPPYLEPPTPPTFPPFPPRSAQEVAAATAAAAERAATAATAHARQWATNVHPEVVPAVARGAPKAPGLELEADGAVGTWLSKSVALLSLKTGQLLLVSLRFEGRAAASKMQIAVAGSAPVASCAVTLTPDLLFLGSAVGDGLLVRFREGPQHAGVERSAASSSSLASAGSGASAEQAAKRRRIASLASFDMGGSEGSGLAALRSGSSSAAGAGLAAPLSSGEFFSAEGEWELYRSAIGRSSSALLPPLLGDGLRQSFQVMDSLMCLGPMRSTALAELHLLESSIAGGAANQPTATCLLAAVGADKSGALALLRRGLPVDVITEVPGMQVHGAWAVVHRRPHGEGAPALGASRTLDAAGRVLLDGEELHSFLFMSVRGEATMVIEARGDFLDELHDDKTLAFVRDTPSLAVGELLGATTIVQVTHTALRLAAGASQLLQELRLPELLRAAGHPAAREPGSGEQQQQPLALDTSRAVCIKYAQIRDPYVLLLLSDATVLLLQANAQERRLALLTAALPELAAAGRDDPLAAATAACLYTDTSGWLASAVGLAVPEPEAPPPAEAAAPQPAQQQAQGQQEQAQEQPGEKRQEAGQTAESEQPEPMQAEGPAAAVASPSAAGDPGGADAAMAEAAAEQAGQPSGSIEAAAAAGAAAGTDAAAADPGAGAKQQAPSEASLAAAELTSDGDGVQQPDAAAETVQTAAAAAAVAAEDATAAAGGTARAVAAAGAVAADAVEAAAAQAAGEGPEAAAAAAASQLATPFAATTAGAEQQQQQEAAPQQPEAPQQPGAPPAGATAQPRAAGPASFCCIMRAGGGLQLYALPSMTCVFEDAEALLGHQVLGPSRPPSLFEDDSLDEELSPSPVTELIMECFAASSGGATGVAAAAAPLLVALRDSGTALVYKAFKPASAGSSLGFRRQPLDASLLGHESPAPAAAPAGGGAAPQGPAAHVPGMPPALSPPCRLVRFDNLATPLLSPPMGPGGLGGRQGPAQQGDEEAARGGAPGAPRLRYSGIFVAGGRPLWLVASRGWLLAHPGDSRLGAASVFTPFHNANCHHGFLAAAPDSRMLIACLPVQLRLDQPWLASKLPLRATPLALAVYPEAHLIALATTRLAAPPRPFLPPESGGDAVAAAAYATAEAATKAAGVEDLAEVQLLAPPGFGVKPETYHTLAEALKAAAAAAGGAGSSGGSGGLLPVPSIGGGAGGSAGAAAGSGARAAAAVAAAAGWAGLPLWRHSLLPGEEIMTLRCVSLCEGGNEAAQPEPYIAVGCATSFGEDYPALGRVLLLQVIKTSVFRLEGGSETRLSGRLALQREVAGPVTALDSLRGYLIMSVGFRLEMHYKQGVNLVKAAFFDGPQLVTSLSLIKDFMLVGRAAGHSAAFFRYSNVQDKYTRATAQQLQQLSADTDKLEAWAVEFMPNATKLIQVMSDGGGNLSVLAYDKADPESWAGQKLLRRGAAHVGAWVCGFSRLRLSVPDDPANRQALLAATAEGGLLLLSPFWDEQMFRRLASLHGELVYRLPHAAGLNPRAFQGRYARAGPTYGAGFGTIRPIKPADNGLLQGDLLWAYAGLDVRTQAVIAEAVGAQPDELLADLRALSLAAGAALV